MKENIQRVKRGTLGKFSEEDNITAKQNKKPKSKPKKKKIGKTSVESRKANTCPADLV